MFIHKITCCCSIRLLLVTLWVGIGGIGAPKTWGQPATTASDRAEVAIIRWDVPERSEPLTVQVAYPKTGAGPFPVVLFSHGFGADHTAFAPVSRHWAERGYVVLHPKHQDGVGVRTQGDRAPSEDGERSAGSTKRLRVDRKPFGTARRETDSEVDRPQSYPVRKPNIRQGLGTQGAPRMGMLRERLESSSVTNNRIRDMTYLLDHLADVPNSIPALAGKLDLQRIGVGGHSLGAYITMLLGGVTVSDSPPNAHVGASLERKGKSYWDPRVRCILPISGQGVGQQGLTASSWNNLKLPMMTITGTRDRNAFGGGLESKREPYDLSPPGDKYLVIIANANHFSFGGRQGSRGQEITDAVMQTSTLFWDAYLKVNAQSKAQLKALPDRSSTPRAYECFAK